ncbi:unnamed protein product [Rangifer tarandus platyrhynchus]|uniref:Uncharacterized protein n=2 Tax=Rangifer tarandus platyrhynchus TaxID=3082113 RepID=A0ACB0DYY6_RANTA|nr:unnamed protein product [Rangifer tarandus platyrhynchus]CAI9693485.1 unnamed protein product [Rangifer tarandus platyrhynchus]
MHRFAPPADVAALHAGRRSLLGADPGVRGDEVVVTFRSVQVVVLRRTVISKQHRLRQGCRMLRPLSTVAENLSFVIGAPCLTVSCRDAEKGTCSSLNPFQLFQT